MSFLHMFYGIKAQNVQRYVKSGPTIKVKFSDLCLILSQGPLYTESRIAADYVHQVGPIHWHEDICIVRIKILWSIITISGETVAYACRVTGNTSYTQKQWSLQFNRR